MVDQNIVRIKHRIESTNEVIRKKTVDLFTRARNAIDVQFLPCVFFYFALVYDASYNEFILQMLSFLFDTINSSYDCVYG